MAGIIVKLEGDAVEVVDGNRRAAALVESNGWFEATGINGEPLIIAKSGQDGQLRSITREELLARFHRKTNAGAMQQKQNKPYYRAFERH